LGSTLLAFARAPSWAEPVRFAVEPGMAAQVEFWVQIFVTYDADQVLIHDTVHLDRVYSILNFQSLSQSGLSEGAVRERQRGAEDEEKKRIRALLGKLHRFKGGAGDLTVEELRIRSLFDDDPDPKKFQRAADPNRIRGQRGLRSRFREGIQRSRRYLPAMEQTFRAEGVPVEITRLPLVESSFNTHAYSKVGAAGMWQFMPGTGRAFLHISDAVDERLDPFVSTRAAARFLKQNYERLGTWPLAITAYNHGPAGMSGAVRKTGTTDIVQIIKRYQSPTFGFASRNFYAEFLAALEVDRRYEDYYGPIDTDEPLITDEVGLAHYVPVDSVVGCTGSDVDTLKQLNPAVRPAALNRRGWLPRGYQLRMPSGTAAGFEDCYAKLPPSVKLSTAPGRTHRVRPGETLGGIARRYGVSIERLRSNNDIRNRNVIRVGQELKIPISGPSRASAGAKASASPSRASSGTEAGASLQPARPAPRTHRVRRGETLGSIALLYSVSAERLRSHNGVGSRDLIRVGQRLGIPGTGSRRPLRTSDHEVQRGQTLAEIANRYGYSVEHLRRHNNLRNKNHIRTGQVLEIPNG
jgi:membrane-bound lytic murein transglycosylase D